MNRLVFFLFAVSIFFQLLSCKSNPSAVASGDQTDFRIGFYNVENLFDTIDIMDKKDEEFTPNSKKEWNTERYHKKLNDLAKIVAAIEYPAILGVCEVENKTVLEDFSKKTSLKKYNYDIVHYESPDQRGIDVALLYQKKFMKVLSSKPIRINFPRAITGEENYTSRDILYVEGQLKNKEILHLFVNHFPSRRGGLAASEPKRIHVANYLKKDIETIQKKNQNANIILLGDFNDETDNNSIAKTLGAKMPTENPAPADLINCSAER
ncbi:MAG: endonuclease/exonuclease/phosphatase family protein, partial [Bacteroidota bacterium]